MDTIAAAITPLVSSPVIVIRISGDDALKSFGAMRTIKGNPCGASILPNYVRKYKFFTSDGFSDDVMATYFKAPKSFTGEDVVEISFHGNPILLRSVFSTLYSLGIRDALPGEFSKRAFLNGKMDLTQAEAVQELISAKTSKGIHYAYARLAGSVRHELDAMKSELLEIKAIIEAKIDFPEEDTIDDIVPILTKSIASVLRCSEKLSRSYESLRFSEEKASVVLAGKPNVGKSSILNALLNEERAIVSSAPGTTRDFIKEEIYLGGLPIEIVDTAGVRDSKNEIESAGIEKSFAKISSADLVLVIIDLASEISVEDKTILALTENTERIIVGNKSDKSLISPDFIDILVSAKTGENIDGLREAIRGKIASKDRTDDSTNVALVTERHYFLLNEAEVILRELSSNIEKKHLDMIAFDLDYCLNKFGEITGERYTEEVLDIVFSKFCIGK